MKKLVGISIVMLASLWILLLSVVVCVCTYTTTETSYSKRVTGNIISADTKGIKTDYTVLYSVGEKEYTTDFSIYLYNLKDCELLLDDANNVVNLGITYDFCKSAYFYCSKIVMITFICLFISFIIFEILSGERKSERREEKLELCEKVQSE